MVPIAVVVLEVIVGMMFSDPRFQDKPFVLSGVAGGQALESVGNLMADQPIKLNPRVIRFRAFLQMEMGVVCGLIAGIIGFLRVDEDWCLLVKEDDSWTLRWIWDLLGFCIQEGTQELDSKVLCFPYC